MKKVSYILRCDYCDCGIIMHYEFPDDHEGSESYDLIVKCCKCGGNVAIGDPIEENNQK